MLKPARMLAAIAAALFCAIAMMLLAHPASAADIATLSNGSTLRHDHHMVLGDVTRLFFSGDDTNFIEVPTAEITGFEKDLTPPAPPPTSAPGSFPATAPLRAPTPAPPVADLNQVVNSASATYHLDPDLVNSVIHAESGFNARAVSPKGARGLMQLMPSTANELGVNNAFNAQQNVGGGSKYLRELLERYNFDLVKALAAYNAGPERVDRYHGVPPFRETRAYVARIINEYNRKVAAQEKAEALARRKGAPQSAKQTAAKPAANSATAHKRSPKSPGQLAAGSTAAPSPSAVPSSANTPR